MQIRKQLERTSNALALDGGRPVTCPEQGAHLGLGKVCRLGYYHSVYTRLRKKSLARHHGTRPRHSKKRGGSK